VTKKIISLAINIIPVLIVLAILWSVWSSLKDTQLKLQTQREKKEELDLKEDLMNRYVDSLKTVLNFLKERETRLALERDEYRAQLVLLEYKYKENLKRIDGLWEVTEINRELNDAFPHWKDQFWQAKRPDGIHGIIVPQFFGAEVLEIKNEYDKSSEKLAIKDKEIENFEETLVVKDEKISVIKSQRDSIKTTYDNLSDEYETLHTKYNKEVKSGWFKINPGNVVSAGVGVGLGLGAGYLIWNSSGGN
jgi:hypothetical protein